jgi:hypothetical protein
MDEAMNPDDSITPIPQNTPYPIEGGGNSVYPTSPYDAIYGSMTPT